MRRIYHQVDGKLVEGPSPQRWHAQSAGHYVVPDIKPYRTTGGKIIGSRSAHRQYLAERGAIEVGNEKAAFMAQTRDTGPSKAEMQAEIKEAIDLCRAGKAAKGAEIDPQVAEHLDLTVQK